MLAFGLLKTLPAAEAAFLLVTSLLLFFAIKSPHIFEKYINFKFAIILASLFYSANIKQTSIILPFLFFGAHNRTKEQTQGAKSSQPKPKRESKNHVLQPTHPRKEAARSKGKLRIESTSCG
ncbi:hypothetical protein BN874_1410004 [Candidatus Contendobacter odensis Run_B_J11]|uniref:Uncharacterized protein n=1 Tax=Candidatus Contendobacter odensis Run_B_J11 TaxID=1400861 RepID=A0A7U7GA67_9GAMM|nr:hypothetical protein BN874_1410004 [Candidatus Contendobacter odensis Run_B_J11]